jgi:hypothetical protein
MKLFRYIPFIFTLFVYAQETATISGFVRDEATGEPLSYANVFIIEQSRLLLPFPGHKQKV